MRRRALKWLASKLPTRVIYGGAGNDRYLSRSYLFGRPVMPDGSSPFDHFGDTCPGAIWPAGVGLYLHCFHQGDEDRELHNHPWAWAVSLVLAGGYIEERKAGDQVERREVLPGDINRIHHGDFHRVDLLDGECWSLFLAGPKVSSWGFWDRATGVFMHWRDFLNAKRRVAA